MIIAINLRLLNPGKIGGQEGYVRNTIKYLLRVDPATKILIFATKSNIDTFNFDSDQIQIVLLPKKGYGKVILDTIISHNVDIYFCPLMVLEPILVHVPTVVNIPDLQHEFMPDFFSKESLDWRRLHYNASVANATAVLTVSDFSRNTFSEKLGIMPAKVFCTHLAGDDVFHGPINPEVAHDIRIKYSLPETYGYFPANTWPHKNHICLIEAMHLYKEKYGSAPKIVLTGAEDTGHSDLLSAIRKYNLDDDIVFLGYLPKNELPYLYYNAAFLVFPSLFEGFGIPAIEAMLSCCPVICSNTTSLPEVAGDAALYFDPTSPDDLCDKIHQLLTNDDLRQNLIAKGTLQASKYSWEKTAVQSLSIFRGMLASGKPAIATLPRLSVITPSYNQGQFIEETILSVLGQGYSNLEYLVMDGGSSDETVEILKKYEDRLTWVSEKDDGQGDAVNKGFHTASGEILGWLNSDDTYLPGAFDKVISYFEAHPDVVMVYGNAYYTDKDSIITSSYPSEPFNAQRLSENCYICQPSVFLRASVLHEVGELDVSLRTCMDFEYWIRLSKAFTGRIAFLDDYLATSRMYEENKTLSLREKVYDEITVTVKKHFGYVADSWMYGYIVDVIEGVFLYSLSPPLRPFRRLFYWYYVLRFALHLKSVNPISAAVRVQERKHHNQADTRYPDGWVSDACNISLTKKKRHTSLKVTGRNLSPFDEPLKIVISAYGQLLAEKYIEEKGEFTFVFQLPAGLVAEQVLDLHFLAGKTFVPKDLGINDDARMLSFILDKVVALP